MSRLPGSENPPAPLSFAAALRVFLPFAFGYFLSYLYRTINAVLAPNLAADIGIAPSELGLLTSVYFITFAAFQLPLGVLLDRFGPRRIEAALLVVAAGGALVFSQAQTLFGLLLGRGLIGFGVSACLMAAFKAFVLWFPRQQIPQINGFQMAAGGLGALVATSPVEASLSVTDWRGVFLVLALLTLAVAAVIFWVVPERPIASQEHGLREQIAGVASVFSNVAFWRIAPWATLAQASLLSIHGLWAGPWLRDVAGFDRSLVANTMLWMSGAMAVGFILFGTAAERLSRRGISAMAVAAAGMLLFMGTLLVLLFDTAEWATGLWGLFGFLGASAILPYAVLSQCFPVHLSGRVNTALNLLVFVGAFAAQWGMGTIIGLWPVTETGGYSPLGYRAAFGVMLGLQGIAALWFWAGGYLWREKPNS